MAKIFIKLNCPQCLIEFMIERHSYNSKLRRKGYKMYCSRQCYIKSKIKLPALFECKICHKSIINDKGYKIRSFCSKECVGKSLIGSHTNKGYTWTEKQRKNLSGKNSFLWKGGVTKINKLLRSSKKFKDWRKSVFERDNFTCQLCKTRGGELHPHHIKQFAFFPELRFELDNGLTLCRKCHKKTHSYGKTNYL